LLQERGLTPEDWEAQERGKGPEKTQKKNPLKIRISFSLTITVLRTAVHQLRTKGCVPENPKSQKKKVKSPEECSKEPPECNPQTGTVPTSPPAQTNREKKETALFAQKEGRKNRETEKSRNINESQDAPARPRK